MLKREWGAESNDKLPHLSITNKTATWVHKFVVEYLPLSRTATLVPELVVKDLPLGRTLMMIIIYIYITFFIFLKIFHFDFIFWKNFLHIIPRPNYDSDGQLLNLRKLQLNIVIV